MNTKTMEQFKTLNDIALSSVEGGDGGAFGLLILGYIGGKIIDGAIADSTASCRKNPNQWFCVRV